MSVHAHRTEWVIGSEGREGAKRVGGGIGVGCGNGDGNGVGCGNGDVNNDGEGDRAGTGTGVEANKGAKYENGRLNPLPMDITTEAEALFDNHPRLKNKALLLNITVVNPCAGFNLGNAARHVGKHLADAVERKKNKYRGLVSRYLLLPSSRCVNLW